MSKKKKVLYIDDNDDISFLSDDEILKNLFEKPKKKKLKRSSSDDESSSDNLKKEIEDINNNKVDIKEKVLLLKEIPLNEKAHIIYKLDQSRSGTIFSSDQNKTLNWINNITKIPFGIYNNLKIEDPKRFLVDSKKHLDSVSYGHTRTKEQILEYIAKLITNPNAKGNVVALQGMAGTGKTSLIRKGLSKVLNRPFYSINFGGLTDPSILLGHSSTYIGSKYGRIVDIIIKSNCMNPIIYLDEIDKISSLNSNGATEVFGILTHLLDEEQNHEFQDNYLDGIKLNLSKVLFVVSFNNPENIDKIVKDRLKIIHVDNPSNGDKIQIAKKYLIPELLQEFNLNVEFTDEIIKNIIYHTNEPGVRQLKKHIETILEKVNLQNIIGDNLDLSYKIPKGILTKEVINSLIQSQDSLELSYYT